MDFPLVSLFALVLLFLDGLIFGFAARKGVAAVILVIIGIILAGFIGFNIPFLSLNAFTAHVQSIILSTIGIFQGIVYAFPILWIFGFLLGLLV